MHVSKCMLFISTAIERLLLQPVAMCRVCVSWRTLTSYRTVEQSTGVLFNEPGTATKQDSEVPQSLKTRFYRHSYSITVGNWAKIFGVKLKPYGTAFETTHLPHPIRCKLMRYSVLINKNQSKFISLANKHLIQSMLQGITKIGLTDWIARQFFTQLH